MTNKFFIFLFLLFSGVSLAADLSLYQSGMNWKDEYDQTFQLEALNGKKTIITMAYTSCQGTCPMIVKKLKKIEKLMIEKNIPYNVVIVSYDPKIDNAQRSFNFYREKMGIKNKEWHFLNGSDSDTRKLSLLLGIKFARNPQSGMIIHDNKIFLIDEQGHSTKRLETLDEDEKNLF